MKIIAVFAIIILILALVWLAIRAWQNYFSQREVEQGEWSVEERALPNRQYGIFLIKPGEEDQLYGETFSQKLSPWEFEEVLAERRVGAQDRADTLNRRLTA